MLDEVGLGRIRERIDHLIDDVLLAYELHDRNRPTADVLTAERVRDTTVA
jgi:hypothetical protein